MIGKLLGASSAQRREMMPLNDHAKKQVTNGTCQQKNEARNVCGTCICMCAHDGCGVCGVVYTYEKVCARV